MFRHLVAAAGRSRFAGPRLRAPPPAQVACSSFLTRRQPLPPSSSLWPQLLQRQRGQRPPHALPCTSLRFFRCVVEGTPNPAARKITPVAADGSLLDVVADDDGTTAFSFAQFRRRDVERRGGASDSGSGAGRGSGGRAHDSGEAAVAASADVPLVSELFAASNIVQEVFLSSSFLSVALAEGADWDDPTVDPGAGDDGDGGGGGGGGGTISDAVLGAVDHFFEDGPADARTVRAWLEAAVSSSTGGTTATVATVGGSGRQGGGLGAADDGSTVEERQLAEDVQLVLDQKARPNLQADGGDVVFRGLKDGVVTLSMVGACSSCPSSTVTMRFMLRNLLMHYFPGEVTDVVQAEEDVQAYNDENWTG